MYTVLLVLLTTALSLSLTTASECSFVYGEWSQCIDSVQTRTISCLCSNVTVSNDQCFDVPLPLEQECKLAYYQCSWKWSKWSLCSAECGGGNTTRTPLCYCDNLSDAVPDIHCNMDSNYGIETVPCNQYICGQVPAFNKLYWISKVDSLDWPLLSTQFSCSMGSAGEDSPKGKTYSEVLTDPYTASHTNYQWYYLAKEWIAVKLNIQNGVQFSQESLMVISQASKLLEHCEGFPEDQLPLIYGLKEKLGRLNNNIGGLSNVDAQIALLTGGGDNEEQNENASRSLIVVSIVVPVAALMIIVAAFGMTIFYVREKTNIAQDQFVSESDDEEDTKHTIESLPLGDQIALYEDKDETSM